MNAAIRATSAVLFAAALAASVVPALLHLLAVDACLDSGGVYDYVARACCDDVASLPVPPPCENLDYATSAIAVLGVVASASVVAALGSSPLRRFHRVRSFVRWGGAILLLAYALIALNSAAASVWLAGGPPTPVPRAWWGQAVRSFWFSMTALLTAIGVAVALRRRRGSDGGERRM